VKTVLYSPDALIDLRKYRAAAARITGKMVRYAETGAGDVTPLVGVPGKRLRVGDFRVIFDEDATTIRVIRIGPRGGVYD
jgi:mRNA interferase RelE/StbE